MFEQKIRAIYQMPFLKFYYKDMIESCDCTVVLDETTNGCRDITVEGTQKNIDKLSNNLDFDPNVTMEKWA